MIKIRILFLGLSYVVIESLNYLGPIIDHSKDGASSVFKEAVGMAALEREGYVLSNGGRLDVRESYLGYTNGSN